MLTIPDIQAAPTFDFQAIPDATDWAAQSAVADGYGVISGCQVTAQTSPNMTVQVSAGLILNANLEIIVDAVTSLVIPGANLTDRRDIVVASPLGVVSLVTGTPCPVAGWIRTTQAFPPVKPAIPAGYVLLGEIAVQGSGAIGGGTIVIAAGNILDKTVLTDSANTPTMVNGYVSPRDLPTNVGGLPQLGLPHMMGEFCHDQSVLYPNGNQADSLTALANRETQIGQKFGIFHTYASPWNWQFLAPGSTTYAAAESGHTVVLSWAWDVLTNMTGGTDDTAIGYAINGLKAFPYPVIIRMGWEMNIAPQPWINNNTTFTAAAYIATWQYIWNKFKAAGVTNVSWFWCPNVEPTGTNWRQFYPGDDYVDYIGCDGYNSFTGSWFWAEAVYENTLQDFIGGMGGLTDGTKPMIIGEWGTFNTPGTRAFWLYDTMAYFKSRGVAAVVYFDTDDGRTAGTGVILSDVPSQKAFAAMAADPDWGGGGSLVGQHYGSIVSGDSPIVHVKFGNSSDGSEPPYESVAGFALSIVGTVRFGVSPMSPGLGSKAVIFKGALDNGATASSGRIVIENDLGTSGSAMGTAGYTIEYLFLDDPTSASGKVFGVTQAGSGQFITATNNGGVYTWNWSANGNPSRKLVLTGVLNDAAWHHVVWNINPAGVDSITIDNVLQSPTVTNLTGTGFGYNNWNEPMYLGEWNFQGSASSGSSCGLDQFAIFAGQLTSTQITNHWNALVGGAPSGQIKIGPVTYSVGTGVPIIGAAVGDRWLRTDTPGTANQRDYICTVAGPPGSATWVGYA